MAWLPILLFVVIVMVALLWLLKLPRKAWEAVAAALVLGLAGYATQANVGQPGAPAMRDAGADFEGASLVEARLQFAELTVSERHTIVTADAMMRNGRFAYAADFLNGYLDDNPGDTEAWTALGNALFAQAEGNPTEAAIEAWRQAVMIDESDPAPYFFLGVGWLRAGEFARARELWQLSLDRTEPDSPARATMEMRLAQLDTMLTRAQAIQKQGE